MDRTPSDTETVHVAIDDLLAVVAKAAEDLRRFHDTVARAKVASLPPFPRAAVAVTVSVIDGLNKIEYELREVLTALGLPESSSP